MTNHIQKNSKKLAHKSLSNSNKENKSSEKENDDYICIPSKALKKGSSVYKLSHETQKEINQLLKTSQTITIPSSEKKLNAKEKKRPSPYIVNLKSETIHKKNKQEETIERDEINIIIFPKHEIDEQFTPLIESLTHPINLKKKFKKKLIKGFLIIIFFLFIGNGIYTVQKFYAIQKTVFTLTKDAFSNLQDGYNAARQSDYTIANMHFSIATREFIDAEKEITNINPIIRKAVGKIPTIGTTFTSGHAAILAGSRLSLTAKYMTQGLYNIENEPLITEKLSYIKNISERSLPLIRESILHINTIAIDQIPKEHRPLFIGLKEKLPLVEIGTQNFINISEFLIDSIGHTEKRRYLVAFQNNTELRSAGGFIGSFALIDIYKGRITQMEVPNTGSYQLQGGLQKNIIPPKPLQLIAKRWEFQDSNWDADFKQAAQQMENLFTLSWGPSVDGVIAINLPIMEKLLKLTGPVELPNYKKTLTAENFWIEVQRNVEKEYDKTKNNPKQIISDLAPIIIDRIVKSDPKQFVDLITLINGSLIEKDLQIYTKNPDSQKLLETYGWAGRIEQTEGDYFYLVENNIAGGKTDRVMEQKVDFKSVIEKDGSIINTVKIKRTHTGSIDNDFTNIRNVSYLRVYVPLGSELIQVDGFTQPDKKYFKTILQNAIPDTHTLEVEDTSTILKPSNTIISEEYGKTVFGNWAMVDPNKSIEITLTYKLPVKIQTNQNSQEIPYSLLIQKQPGTKTEFTININSTDKKIFTKETKEAKNNIIKTISLIQDQKFNYILK